jgi:hypothetical protein
MSRRLTWRKAEAVAVVPTKVRSISAGSQRGGVVALPREQARQATGRPSFQAK